jgi:hypothetical protein
MFPYAQRPSFTRKTQKLSNYRNGMVVAESTAIAFVPSETWGARLTKGGRQNALDDFCNSVGPVVTRRG